MLPAFFAVAACFSLLLNVHQYTNGQYSAYHLQFFQHHFGILSVTSLRSTLSVYASNFKRKLTSSPRARPHERTRAYHRSVHVSSIFDTHLPAPTTISNVSITKSLSALKHAALTVAVSPFKTISAPTFYNSLSIQPSFSMATGLSFSPSRTARALASNNALVLVQSIFSTAAVTSLSAVVSGINNSTCAVTTSGPAFETVFALSMLLGFVTLVSILAWFSPDPRKNWRLERVTITGALDIEVHPIDMTAPVIAEYDFVLDEATSALIEQSLAITEDTADASTDADVTLVDITDEDEMTLANTSEDIADLADTTLAEESSSEVQKVVRESVSLLTALIERFYKPKRTAKYIPPPPKPSISGPSFFDNSFLAQAQPALSEQKTKKRRSKKLKVTRGVLDGSGGS